MTTSYFSLLQRYKAYTNMKSVTCSVTINDDILRDIVLTCRNLNDVDLSKCLLLTKVGIGYLAELPALHSLNLSMCNNASDTWMTLLSKSIEKIDLSNCPNITDFGVFNLSRSCPWLTSISLSGCELVTDESAHYIAVKCNRLKFLYLSNTKVSDVGLTVISARTPWLVELDISNCIAVSDVGLVHLADRCEYLELINVVNCQQVTETGIALLIQNSVWNRKVIF